MKAIHNVSSAGHPEDLEKGFKLLSEGKMGTVILAGGMGTRLGFPHPKGLFPISPVKEKSLFQIFAEKTAAASLFAHTSLKLAIMTSSENRKETEDHFKNNQLFGLDSSQLYFFNQGERALEDAEGNPIGPLASDGNGGFFKHFVASGVGEKWQKAGIEYLNIILVDNALADPWDINLLGYHANQKAEATIKCIKRISPEEKVGLLVEDQGSIKVVEYSEISVEDRFQLDSQGNLKFRYANLSLFCFSLPFVKKMSGIDLPWHVAIKPSSSEPGSPLYYKKETFIFDFLSFSKDISLLVYPREKCFSPLKNKSGSDSKETVKKDLEIYDLNLMSALTGKKWDSKPFELSAKFHYPTPALKQEWRGKNQTDQTYIS